MLSLVASSALGAPTTPMATPPTFAQDFYVGRQDALAINQGGYAIDNGMCCSLQHSSQCKIQGINMGADTYEQGSKERTRSDSAQGSIVNWWGTVKKQMALVPGSSVNSTHKFACAQYCPLDGEFTPSIQIGDGQKGFFDTPKDRGQASVTQPAAIGGATKTCEHWKWTETILKILPMSTSDFYVDMSTTPPAPFFVSQVIKPFNRPIGQENSSFVDYQPMDTSSHFDIDPDSITQCKLPPNGCQQQSNGAADIAANAQLLLGALAPHIAAHETFFPPAMVYEEAQKVAKAAAAPAAPSGPLPPQPDISFVADFTAHEEVLTKIAQGSSVVNGDPCCLSNGGAPQCQVQLQHRGGVRYMDVTNNRTRFEDAVANQVIVDDYKVRKTMLVNTTNGVDTCQEYCPIDPDDKLEPIDPFDPFDTTKDLGPTTLDGKQVEHYQWKDKILKIITMSTTDFYADITNKKAAIPVYLHQELTPLGQHLGTTNQTWSAFTAGTPPAAKFNIAGVATCPQSSQCGQQSMQAHRLATRQLHTAARYMRATA